MPLQNLQYGEWYLVVNCKKCHVRQVLFHDLSKGRSLIMATYTYQCADCHETADYDGHEIERYQHDGQANDQA